MQRAVNTFSGGINTDTSINKYGNTNVLDSLNFTLLNDRRLSSQALFSIRGSLAKANIAGDGVAIKGHIILRDSVILFIKTPTTGRIYKFQDFGAATAEAGELELIYENEDLVFQDEYDIVGVGRYETDDVQKIYFSDGHTFFYHMNIIHNADTNPLTGINKIPVNSMELVSDVMFESPTYSVEVGGNLKSGRIQYCYQLYNINGAETGFSPTTPLINLTSSDDNASNTLSYRGNKQDTVVNKSVRLTIPIAGNSASNAFIRLRLVAIQYDSDIVEPSVRVVGEYDIKELTSLIVTDSGQVINTSTLDEIRFIQQNLLPKIIETKDNILFAGNVESDYFHITDEEFDSRAYRFDTNGICILNWGDTGGDPNNSEFPINYANVATTNVPLQHSAYNIFNDLDKDRFRHVPIAGKTTDYRYTNIGVGMVLGGKGKYIEYEFITVSKPIDTEPTRHGNTNMLPTYYGYPKLQVSVEAPFENYANYKTAAELVGYQRDEIYAFAIVFFDNKGRQSFAKWIGDIRFPDNSTHPFITYDTESGFTLANILGIKFKVTIPSTLQDKVSGYQIVRCERRDFDRTVKAAGLIAYPLSKGKEAGDNKMYCAATVPTVSDCYVKSLRVDRWTQDLNNISYPTFFLTKGAQLNNKFVEMSSPELSFNKKLTSGSNDIIEVVGSHSGLNHTAVADIRASNVRENYAKIISEKYRNFVSYPNNISDTNFLPYSRVKPKVTKVFTQPDSQFSPPFVFPEGYSYSKQVHNNGDPGTSGKRNLRHGLRGTHLMALLDSTTNIFINDEVAGKYGNAFDHRVMYGYYRRNNAKGIYNGTDYSARKTRTYYKASEFIPKDRTTSVINKTTVTTVETTMGTGAVVLDVNQNLVTFENRVPGLPNIWEIRIEVPQPADIYTVFEIMWKARREDIGGPIETITAYVGVNEGETSGIIEATNFLTNDNSEWWTIEEQKIVSFTPTTQYSVSGALTETGYTTETTTVEETVDSIVVFGGDTYIDYHIDYRSMWDKTRGSDGRRSIKSIVMYPVESTINLALRIDNIQANINWHAHVGEGSPALPEAPKYHLQERLVNGINMWGADYPTDFGDMYQYNKAYSAMDKTKIFVPEPFDFKNTVNFDTRVYASDLKINGEYSDSWLKFKFNSYIDVDSAYGKLITIINSANRLVFFQPNGVGILSVNDRALVEDNNAGKLTLGTGGVLPRFDYISYNTGVLTPKAVVKADSSFYYIDAQRKRIYSHQGGDVPVSVLKGINSALAELNFTYVRTGFEPKLNKVHFTIDDKTFVYNEFQQCFTHRTKLVPVDYITLKNNFYTVKNAGEPLMVLVNDSQELTYDGEGNPVLISDSDDGAIIYKQGVGTTGILDNYANTADSFVELIINPEGVRKCTFNNIEFTMEVIDTNENLIFQDTDAELNPSFQPIFETIKEVTFSNSYITKTVTIEYGKNIKKIGKTWRMQVPLVADRKVPTRSVRFVDTYLKVKITFDNSKAHRLRLHDIITYYSALSV